MEAGMKGFVGEFGVAATEFVGMGVGVGVGVG